jgi:hypothetical protein
MISFQSLCKLPSIPTGNAADFMEGYLQSSKGRFSLTASLGYEIQVPSFPGHNQCTSSILAKLIVVDFLLDREDAGEMSVVEKVGLPMGQKISM